MQEGQAQGLGLRDAHIFEGRRKEFPHSVENKLGGWRWFPALRATKALECRGHLEEAPLPRLSVLAELIAYLFPKESNSEWPFHSENVNDVNDTV